MFTVGKINNLPIVEITEKGCFIAADEERLFIPLSQMKENSKVGDIIEAFIYYDDDRLTATAKRPKATVGDLAYLPVIGSNKYGYFLNNGIRKDLFLPFDRIKTALRVDDYAFVYVYLDHEQRLCCTTKYEKYFKEQISPEYKLGDRVKVLPITKTPIGIKVLVENKFFAMLLNHDLPKDQNIKFGKKIYAYIKNIRPDQKVDLTLVGESEKEASSEQYQTNEELSAQIIKMLKEHGGFLPFNDHSDPKVILKIFKVSKGIFKKTIGNLYKQNIITIEFTGIKLK